MFCAEVPAITLYMHTHTQQCWKLLYLQQVDKEIKKEKGYFLIILYS